MRKNFLEKWKKMDLYEKRFFLKSREDYGLIRGIIILKYGEGFALFEVLY